MPLPDKVRTNSHGTYHPSACRVLEVLPARAQGGLRPRGQLASSFHHLGGSHPTYLRKALLALEFMSYVHVSAMSCLMATCTDVIDKLCDLGWMRVLWKLSCYCIARLVVHGMRAPVYLALEEV